MVRTIVQSPKGANELSEKAKRLLAAHDRETRVYHAQRDGS